MTEPPHARFGTMQHGLPALLADEHYTTLAQGKGVRIERIVSEGQATAPGFWYDQAQAEYVLMLSGRARLEIEGQPELELGSGDWVDIPAHVRHRVAWTTPDERTVWLAVFYEPELRP
jgi:cupin 2 domain-containing protein